MAKGRAVAIVLDAVEQSELLSLTRKHGAAQALAERARIILAAAAGLNNKEVAAKVGVCAATAGTWRKRFFAQRMDGLYDGPRPGAPREIGDDEIAATIRKTLEAPPKGATHWSLRTMGKEIRHSPSTVHRIWQAFRAAAAPPRNLQALLRPVVRREGARHRRSLLVAARACCCAVRRREIPGAGARSHAAAAADAAWSG